MEGRVKIVSNDDSIISELTLENVTPAFAGRFICLTFNPDQPTIQANSSVTLTVEGKACRDCPRANQLFPWQPVRCLKSIFSTSFFMYNKWMEEEEGGGRGYYDGVFLKLQLLLK